MSKRVFKTELDAVNNSLQAQVTNSISKTIVDAKGDLITATGADTPARLAVGSDGETLVADSSTSTGLRWQTGNGLAQGAINGGMDIWQRGTSFTRTTYSNQYGADRWRMDSDTTVVITRESTIVPTGFLYSAKFAGNGTTTPTPFMNQAVETANAIYYAGKTVTISAYQYASSSLSTKVALFYSTVTDETQGGGSWIAITPSSGGTQTANNSWTRNQGVFVIPSSARSLLIQVASNAALGTTQAWYVTGVQMELGSVATEFRRAGGTLAGELAACQRYYWKSYVQATTPGTGTSTGIIQYSGFSDASGNLISTVFFPVTMRTVPTLTAYTVNGVSGQWGYERSGAAADASLTANLTSDRHTRLYVPIGANWTGGNQYGHLIASAEL